MSSEPTTTSPDLTTLSAALDQALIDLLTITPTNAKETAGRACDDLHQALTLLDDSASLPIPRQVGPVLRAAHRQLRNDDWQAARASLVAARGCLSRPISHRSKEKGAKVDA